MKYTQRQWDKDVGMGLVPDVYKYNCPQCEDTGVIPFHKLTTENKKSKLIKCDECVEN